jgi:tagatose-1,6-bisphosphate aldolase non-catalytic subunit AgaZ/GatZ
MVLTMSLLYRLSVNGFALAALTVLAACSSDTNPVRDVFVAVGAGPKTAATPDFVKQSRPPKLDYVPVGTAAPARNTPARTADQVKATEAEMDAARARNEAAGQAAVQAGATPAPTPVKNGAPASPASAKKKKPSSKPAG